MMLADQHRAKIREILVAMQEHRAPVGGGSGRRERYEMRETVLYFLLGQELIALISAVGVREEQRGAFLAKIARMVEEQFDFNPNIVNWSVRFVNSFHDVTYFQEVSKLCKDSFGQLREVVEILAKANPLGITAEDLDVFKRRLQQEITYAEMQSLSTRLKEKYRGKGEDSQVDYDEMIDSLGEVTRRVQKLIDEGTEDDRKKFRELIGEKFIQNLRFSLILLSKDSELRRHRDVARRILSQSGAGDLVMEVSMGKLMTSLSSFLGFEPVTRDRLRKFVPPAEMAFLQKMLKALESEAEYKNFKRTTEIFESLAI